MVCLGALPQGLINPSISLVAGLIPVATLDMNMVTKWFHSTRLETRTKESSFHASVWVENSNA